MQLIATSIVVLAMIGPVQAQPGSSDCSGSTAWTYCQVENNGSSVDVGAGDSQAGDVDNTPRSNSGSAPRPGDEDPEEPKDCGPLNRCETYNVAMLPELTLADIASFRPATPTLTGEPAGFGIVGMPTNLVATASEQHIPGTVLDRDVTVRFTPAAYIFDNGDGTTTRTTTGGAPWTTLHQGQFTPTATSHTYPTRGTYTVSVTVEYTASVDFGSGTWRPIPGVIRAHTTGYNVRVLEARTALVERTCTEDPTGPGC